MNTQAKRLAIIGGGASGLAAAIAAAERACALGCRLEVVVYERDERVGRSILVTGNGRCNFSNARIEAEKYHNSAFVGEVYAGVPEGHALGFLESCGLEWREEADGRRYPLANKASVVVDVLRSAAAHLGVVEACQKVVASVDPPRSQGKLFTLRMDDGVFERADAVIVACGGRALGELDVPCLESLSMRPVLGSLRVSDRDMPFARELDNIRVRCNVILTRKMPDGDYCRIESEAGELMFRKYGVSGICVFNLSRIAQPGDRLLVDFLQEGSREGAVAFMQRRREALAKRFGESLTCADLLRGLVLPRVADAVLKVAGMKGEAKCTGACAEELADWLAAFPLDVAGIGDEGTCQVRRGGFAVDQFDPRTLESHDVRGLYATGEALDVDGPCGGYNLHWAWTSGLLAGSSAAQFLFESR